MLLPSAARAVHSVCMFDVWKGNSRLTARTLPNKNNVAREVKFALWGKIALLSFAARKVDLRIGEKSLFFFSRRVK